MGRFLKKISSEQEVQSRGETFLRKPTSSDKNFHFYHALLQFAQTGQARKGVGSHYGSLWATAARPLPSHSQLAANKLCTHAGLNACTQPTVLTQKCSGHGQNQGCGTLHNGGFSVSISSARRSTAFFSHFSPPLRSNEVDSSKDPQSLARARAHSRANKSVVRWFLLRVWMHWGDRQSGVLFTTVHDMSDIPDQPRNHHRLKSGSLYCKSFCEYQRGKVSIWRHYNQY